MKKYLLTLTPSIMGLCCLLAFKIIGGKVAPNGAIIEPFYLIPIGYLLIAIGIFLELGYLIASKNKKIK